MTSVSWFKRNNYCDGSKTPLMRGIFHSCMSFIIMFFLITYGKLLITLKFISMVMIFSSYLASSVFHCVGLPAEKEMIMNLIDHVAIHHHIYGTMLCFYHFNINLILVHFLYLLNYLFDVIDLCIYRHDYIHSNKHVWHYVFSIALSFFNLLNYLIYSIYVNTGKIVLFVLSGSLYITGMVIFCCNMKKSKTAHHLWSFHETFHLFTILGTSIMLYVILSY